MGLSRYVFFFSIVLLQSKIHAQENRFQISEPPDVAELNYKECTFDKEANAVVFVDEAISDYNGDYNLITYHHIKLKILKDKGIKFSVVTIPFYRDDDFEFIDAVEGYVYNYNGPMTVKKLEKKSIYKQNVNKYWGEIKFAFPEVKAGSIIEYRYISEMKHYGGLKEWIFQKEIPVLKSSYKLSILPNTEFAYSVQKNNNLPIDIKPDNNNGKISFEMQDIPGFTDEPYIDSRNDYLQKVSFQLSKYNTSIKYMSDWKQVNKELYTSADFYGQLKKDLPGTDEFINTVKADSLPFNRMKEVYKYVQGNITWNGLNSKYTTDGIKQAWSKKTGASGDINLILVNLLQSVNLDANPILVSERHNGKVRRESTFIEQFNTTYACVTIGDKQYYLNAVALYTPCHLIPYKALNTTAFLINKKNGELVEIKDTSAFYKEATTIESTINEEGNLTGDFFINSYDYARCKRLKDYKTKSQSEFERDITAKIPGLVLNGINIINDTSETGALGIKSKFTAELNNSANYSFLPLNLFTGLDENLFLSSNRFSNINFGYKQSLHLNFHIKIDKKYAVDALPKSVQLSNPDKDIIFKRSVFKDDENNEIRVKFSFDILRTVYTPGEYEMIKDFYKKLYGFLNEQVVLKKK